MIDDKKVRKIILLSFFGIGLIAVVSIITLIIRNVENNNHKVLIDNIDSCVRGISDDSKNTLFSKTYFVVKEQNSIINKEMKNTYHGVFRDGTCETRQYGSNNTLNFGTDAIIDIEELGYSYEVSFGWVKNNRVQADTGTPIFTCLNTEKLLYGEFNCEKNIIIQQEETDKILSVVPYFGDDYVLSIGESKTSKSGYSIILIFDPSRSVYENGKVEEFMEQKTEDAMNYLKENGINIDDYELVKKFKIIE